MTTLPLRQVCPDIVGVRVGRLVAGVEPAIEVVDAVLLRRQHEQVAVGELRGRGRRERLLRRPGRRVVGGRRPVIEVVLRAVLREQRDDAAVGTGEERGRIVIVQLELVVELEGRGRAGGEIVDDRVDVALAGGVVPARGDGADDQPAALNQRARRFEPAPAAVVGQDDWRRGRAAAGAGRAAAARAAAAAAATGPDVPPAPAPPPRAAAPTRCTAAGRGAAPAARARCPARRRRRRPCHPSRRQYRRPLPASPPAPPPPVAPPAPPPAALPPVPEAPAPLVPAAPAPPPVPARSRAAPDAGGGGRSRAAARAGRTAPRSATSNSRRAASLPATFRPRGPLVKELTQTARRGQPVIPTDRPCDGPRAGTATARR